MAMLGTTEWIIILVIVLLLFGASRLPALGAGIGGALKNFKKAFSEGGGDEKNLPAVLNESAVRQELARYVGYPFWFYQETGTIEIKKKSDAKIIGITESTVITEHLLGEKGAIPLSAIKKITVE